MKLKPVKRKVSITPAQPEPEKRQARKKSTNTLPSGQYEPIYEPYRWLIRTTESAKNGSPVKQFLEVSIKRNDADYGLPYAYLSMWQESEFYTGYLKGKTTYLPVNEIPRLIETLKAFYEKGLKDDLIWGD